MTYIDERNIELSENINDFNIGDIVIGINGKESIITNKTSTSIEVKITATTINGITCLQWFDIKKFNKFFKKK